MSKFVDLITSRLNDRGEIDLREIMQSREKEIATALQKIDELDVAIASASSDEERDALKWEKMKIMMKHQIPIDVLTEHWSPK